MKFDDFAFEYMNIFLAAIGPLNLYQTLKKCPDSKHLYDKCWKDKNVGKGEKGRSIDET